MHHLEAQYVGDSMDYLENMSNMGAKRWFVPSSKRWNLSIIVLSAFATHPIKAMNVCGIYGKICTKS